MRPRWYHALVPGLALAAAIWPAAVAAQTRPPMSLPKPRLPESPEVVVLFQAGDYPSNIPRVLAALARKGALETSTVALAASETVCNVYTRILPGGCTSETVKLAQALNSTKRRDPKSFSVGQLIVIPRVKLVEHPFVLKLDPRVGSDRQRLADLQANWKQSPVREEKLPDGYLVLTYPGFELRVPRRSDADARELQRYLTSLEISNVLVTARFLDPGPATLQTSTPPGKFWTDCVATEGQRLPGTVEGDLRLLLSEVEPRQCPIRCQGIECPDVILVDTTVWPHPEIRDYLDADPAPCPTTPPLPTAGSPELSCRVQPFEPALHHGTHLAGIVSSAANEAGIAGVAPGTRIAPVCWPADTVALIEFMNRRQAAGGQPPIYLFASRFPISGPPPTRDDDRLNRNRNPLGVNIVRRRDLWIAAAGQGATHYEEISRRSVESPANLGDQENVVVVTACRDCYGDSAALVDTANRAAAGQAMVHVAAPGIDVPSPVTPTEYGQADGTSQAAALVAGVAAAMKACYPQSYQQPHVVKTRLQTTSQPFPLASDNTPRDFGVSAGIVDIDAALLDPDRDWIRRNGGAWEAVRVRRWNGGFEMDPPGTLRFRTNDLHRLKLMGGAAWVGFSRDPDDIYLEHRGETVRVGPGRLARTSPGPNADPDVLLELCDGQTVTIAELNDLLLATPLGLRDARRSCQ